MTSPHPPTPGMIRLTRLIYALHALTAFFLLARPWSIALIRTGDIVLTHTGNIALISAGIILLILSLSSLVAIVLNYWKRSAVCGTWLDSHFGWQIRTFWWTLAGIAIDFMLNLALPLAWKAISIVPSATGINMPITLVIISAWIAYRVVRGGRRLANGQPMPTPPPPTPCDTEACVHADEQPAPGPHPPTPGMIRLTHLIYALHALTVFFLLACLGLRMPIRTPGIILLCLPLLVAIVLNYWKRSAVRGTWLDSHFGWQIRTAWWWTPSWIVIAIAAFKPQFMGDAITIGFILLAAATGDIFGSIWAMLMVFMMLMVLIITIFFMWVVYRMARGWWRLSNRQPMSGKRAVCTLPHKPCPPRTDPEIS